MTDKTTGIQLGFHTAAFKDTPGALALAGVFGHEEISSLFEFELLLARPTGKPLGQDDMEALVAEPCVLAMGNKMGDIVHGALAEIEHLDGSAGVTPYYWARFVPQAALLDMG